MTQLYENWPLALLDRLHLIGRRSVVYRLRCGVKFLVLAGSLDVRIINEIWVDKVYTPIPEFSICDGWVIVDIGSQKGIFSVLASTSAAGVQVYAFEPFPQNYSFLCRNIRLNALSNVKPYNVAVGGKDGEAILHLDTTQMDVHSLIRFPGSTPSGEIPVQVWSLKRVVNSIEPRINLLKMDIEGMEYEALLSCSGEDLERVERIALEYHDDSIPTGHTVSELVEFLESRGFGARLFRERRILLADRD